MFQRLATGFELAQSSWRVLRTDKHLLIFPALSGLCCLLVLASFAAPFLLRPDWANQQFNRVAAQGEPSPWVWPLLFAFYFCNYFVIVFFNAALISCALIRFNGGTPTLGDGLTAAGSRLPQILAWALVSATVGVLLKVVENIHEKLGAFVSFLLGTAWTVMTYFVVPVLVVEKLGPVDAVKRSVAILKQTWGEALVGRAGIGLFVFLLALPWVALLILGAAVLGNGSMLGVPLLVLAGMYFLVWLAIGPALNGIHLSALYQYAANGKVPEGFDRETMQAAFGPK